MGLVLLDKSKSCYRDHHLVERKQYVASIWTAGGENCANEFY